MLIKTKLRSFFTIVVHCYNRTDEQSAFLSAMGGQKLEFWSIENQGVHVRDTLVEKLYTSMYKIALVMDDINTYVQILLLRMKCKKFCMILLKFGKTLHVKTR